MGSSEPPEPPLDSPLAIHILSVPYTHTHKHTHAHTHTHTSPSTSNTRTSGLPASTGTMRYIAAYMLAILGGNEKPSADDIRMIIESVGVEVEENKLSILMDKLKGKNLTQIQEEGKS